MVHIQNPDYETITAECPHCHTTCLFNRASDIDEPGPYGGRTVPCLSCGEEFWITGDIASPPFEMFIHDADAHFKSKRYMLSVASLAQAWELFFTEFADSNFVWRPFFGATPYDRDVEEVNRVRSQLHEAIADFTFFPLRNLLIRTTVENVHPRTLAESELALRRIRSERFGDHVAFERVENIENPETRHLIKQLLTVTVGNLRNQVVHKNAYRPLRSEVEPCLEPEIVLLYKLEYALGIATFEQFSAGGRRIACGLTRAGQPHVR